jgi:hypothetical protein
VVVTVGKDNEWYSLNGREKVAMGAVPDTGPITFKPAEGLELRSIFLREIKEK